MGLHTEKGGFLAQCDLEHSERVKSEEVNKSE
jgi:hypothetical protein